MRFRLIVILCLLAAVPVQATTYYVKPSGNDLADGLSEGTPFETVGKVNGLTLQPGDQVLFKCGDIWQAEQLVISQSGSESAPITFGSYPAGCANKPADVVSSNQNATGMALKAIQTLVNR